MSWEQLEFDLAEMFDELSNRRYELDAALELWAARRTQQKRDHERTPSAKRVKYERMKRWRMTERAKEARRMANQRWRDKNRDKINQYHSQYQRTRRASKRAANDNIPTKKAA